MAGGAANSSDRELKVAEKLSNSRGPLQFLTDRASGKPLNYQLFIEPKGEHLIPHDQWKEDFLRQVEAEHQIGVKFSNQDFKLVGLPFYNEQLRKQAFEEAFWNALA